MLLLIFILLQVLDAYLTYKIISNGGYELNKVMSWIFDKLGLTLGLIISKVFVSGIALYAFAVWPQWVKTAAVLIMAGVCIWNYVQYKGGFDGF